MGRAVRENEGETKVSEYTRRDFLKTAGLAGAALAVPGKLAGMTPAGQRQASPTATGPGGKRKKVIVVGAGLAGLVAGYELDQAGHEVTILEAQLRPGGRVLTLRAPFSDGLYAEAGASRIPNTHDLTIRYAHEFQLKLVPFYPASGQYVNQIAGERLLGKLGAASHWPVALTAEEQRLGRAGMWQKYALSAAKQLGNPAAPGWSPKPFASLDGVTFTRFLRQQGASAAAVRVMTLGMDYDGASALRILADLAVNGNVTENYKIGGGNDQLPRAMAQRLSTRIHYGAMLQRIEQDRSGVRAFFLQGNLVHQSEADHLICTIPFPVLQRVQFQPPLSDERLNAIDSTHYLSATVLFFQEERRYWQADGLNGFALSDWPVAVSQPTFDQTDPRGILAATLTGSIALREAGLPEDRRISTVLNEMETLFPGARENFEGGVSKAWNNDFWAKGAMQWFRPGQMIEFWPYMASPVGRVHFGGEHTSPWPGWMQGAIHSGLRTAREVQEAAS
jgi:monoamine oxidase